MADTPTAPAPDDESAVAVADLEEDQGGADVQSADPVDVQANESDTDAVPVQVPVPHPQADLQDEAQPEGSPDGTPDALGATADETDGQPQDSADVEPADTTEEPSPDETSVTDEDDETESEEPQARVALGERIYNLLDKALDLVNRPFKWLGSDARQLVGLIAAVTILTSLAAVALKPMLIDQEAPLTFLNQKKAELLLTTTDEPEPATPEP